MKTCIREFYGTLLRRQLPTVISAEIDALFLGAGVCALRFDEGLSARIQNLRLRKSPRRHHVRSRRHQELLKRLLISQF